MRSRKATQEVLSLKQALGHTILSNNHVVSCPSLESIFYIAGSTVVRYSHVEHAQKAFFFAEKPLSSLAVSRDGRYIAAGERGHIPLVIIWDVLKNERVAILRGHKFGVGALAFSNSGRYLVSVGFKADKQLLLWHWREEKVLSTQKLVNKVHAIDFQEDDDYFVTAGDRHLKWWYLHEIIEGESVSVEGKPASIMEEHRTSVFVDVVCGKLAFDGNVYCATASGLLCMFDAERSVKKWVQFNDVSFYSLQLFAVPGASGLLTVGGSSGLIRAFAPSGLEYIATLPVPAPMKVSPAGEPVLAACYSLTIAYPPISAEASGDVFGDVAQGLPRLLATYADRTMILWDLADIEHCRIVRETKAHHSCIWDVKFAPYQPNKAGTYATLPARSFATCAADNSVRVWNVDAVRRPTSSSSSSSSSATASNRRRSAGNSSGDTIDHWMKTIEVEDPHPADTDRTSGGDGPSLIASTATGLSVTHAKSVVDFDYASGFPDVELPDRPQSSYFPRTVAFHPVGTQLACGDKAGRLHIYDVATMHVVYTVQAHSAEILSVAYSPVLVSFDQGKTWTLEADTPPASSSPSSSSPTPQRIVLLATAGRDRLIHVFAAPVDTTSALIAAQYTVVDTLDQHTASVTCVSFTPDGTKMISCGGDKTMVFYQIFAPTQITPYKTIPTPLGSINDIQIDVSNKFVVTSGQDKRLNIWNLHSGKHMRAYKSHPPTTTADGNTAAPPAELFKTAIDPSGSYIVTVDFDKRITLLDFFSGEVLGQLKAHGELITNVAFSHDGGHVVTVGGDGVILVWQVAEVLVRAMQERLLELVMIAQRRNQKLSSAAASAASSSGAVGAMPPPPAHGGVVPPLPPGHEATNGGGGGGLMPPPPPSADMVASSLASLKLKHQANGAVSGAGATSSSASSTTTTTGSRRVSRWRTGGVGVGGVTRSTEVSDAAAAAETVAESDQDVVDAYELHGRKVLVAEKEWQKQRQLNKFTLELTSDVLANEKTWRPPPSDVEAEAVDAASSMRSPNVRAAEDGDDVLMVHHTGDDEGSLDGDGNGDDGYDDGDDVFGDDDGERLFAPRPSSIEPPLPSQQPQPSSQPSPSTEIDPDEAILSSTQHRLDSLQATLNGLEDWLESKLRGDSALASDGSVGGSGAGAGGAGASSSVNEAPSIGGGGEGGLDLSRSISAAFFQQELGSGRRTAAASVTGDVAESIDSLPPAAAAGVVTGGGLLDQRRRENHLRLSAMRDRLRAMGIDDGPAASTATANATVTLTQTMPPPPPPPEAPNTAAIATAAADAGDADAEDLYNTPSTVSSRDEHEQDHGHGDDHAAPSSSSSELLRTQLRDKQQHYLTVLRDLDAAKERALQSYQELLTLRGGSTATASAAAAWTGEYAAMAASTSTTMGGVGGGEDADDEVIGQADHLLAAFRQSLSSFAIGSVSSSTMTMDAPGSTGAAAADGHEAHRLLRASLAESVRASIPTKRSSPTAQPFASTTSSSSNGSNGNDATSNLPEATITAILERYSDRLVDIVGDKLVHKLAVTATPQKKSQT